MPIGTPPNFRKVLAPVAALPTLWRATDVIHVDCRRNVREYTAYAVIIIRIQRSIDTEDVLTQGRIYDWSVLPYLHVLLRLYA